MQENYYDLLGVKKDSTDDEIKKAYRKLAMKLHPDRAQDDKGAEEKFKKINEAYAVLSDPQKKQMYDMGGTDRVNFGTSNRDVDIDEILKNFHSFSNVDDLFGRTGRAKKIFAEYHLGFWESIFGCQKELSITIKNGRGVEKKTVKVNFPKGVASGDELNLKIDSQDILLEVIVEKIPNIDREGNDIFMDVKIPFTVMCLGGKIVIPHWLGDVILTIPAETQTGKIFKMSKKGVSRGKNVGDLYIVSQVIIPEGLSDRQKDIIKKLENELLDKNDKKHNCWIEEIKKTWASLFNK